jgi:hypothetical protein
VLTALEFCGRLNLPTRGHRDDGPLLEYADISHDGGVFRSVLKLMINCGDTVLQQHCQSGKKNAMYFSKTAQNELLDCVRQVIQEQIVAEVKQQPFGAKFGVMADEVTDCANTEQLGKKGGREAGILIKTTVKDAWEESRSKADDYNCYCMSLPY